MGDCFLPHRQGCDALFLLVAQYFRLVRFVQHPNDAELGRSELIRTQKIRDHGFELIQPRDVSSWVSTVSTILPKVGEKKIELLVSLLSCRALLTSTPQPVQNEHNLLHVENYWVISLGTKRSRLQAT